MTAPLQTVNGKATGTVTTLTVALTATQTGSCLVAYVSAFGDTSSPTAVTLTSGTSGTGGSFAADHWTAATTSLGAAGIDAGIWADPGCAASTNAVKVTTNGTSTQTIMVIVEEWPGLIQAGAADQTATPLRQSAGSSTWSVGPTGTTSQASEVVVACAASFNSSASSFVMGAPGAPWTEETQVQDTSGYYQLLAAGYQAVSSTGTFTYNGTAAYKTTACIATLKGAAAATATPAVLAGTVAFTAPAFTAGAAVTTTALAGTAAFSVPAVSANAADVAPIVLAGTVAFSSPAVTAGAAVTTTALAVSAAFAVPALRCDAIITVTGGALAGAALNANPFFTGGSLTGWTGYQGTITASQAVPGGPFPWSCLFTSGGGAGGAIEGSPAAFPVMAGGGYQVSAWVYFPAGGQVDIGFDWENSSHGYLSTATTGAAAAAGVWTAIRSGALTAPASAVFAYPRAGPHSPSAGLLLYAQDVTASAGASASFPPPAIIAEGRGMFLTYLF